MMIVTILAIVEVIIDFRYKRLLAYYAVSACATLSSVCGCLAVLVPIPHSYNLTVAIDRSLGIVPASADDSIIVYCNIA